MKRENFNLIINTLDDQALYREICKKIKDLDAISFKLICLVPVFSGLSISILYSLAEKFSSSVLILIGLFGALITFFLFRWEKKNIQLRDIFRSYAEILETKKIKLENENQTYEMTLGGPYSLLREQHKPLSLHSAKNVRRWSKIEAETAIYGITILFWLLLPILTFFG